MDKYHADDFIIMNFSLWWRWVHLSVVRCLTLACHLNDYGAVTSADLFRLIHPSSACVWVHLMRSNTSNQSARWALRSQARTHGHTDFGVCSSEIGTTFHFCCCLLSIDWYGQHIVLFCRIGAKRKWEALSNCVSLSNSTNKPAIATSNHSDDVKRTRDAA